MLDSCICRRSSIAFLAMMLVFVADMQADEAIERTGAKHVGSLRPEKAVWTFVTRDGKSIALNQLAYVRFGAPSPPLAKAPLMHTLLLPNEQRISGLLERVDEKKVVFVT